MLKKSRTPMTAEDIQGMRAAGKLAARTLEHIEKFIKPGITTLEIDKIIYDFTMSAGATPGTLNYHGFAHSCCTSVNEVICHGVPGPQILKEGDILNVDVTPVLNGYFGDTSATYGVGQISDLAKDIIEVARLARDKGIEVIKNGASTGDIGFVTEKFVSRRGFTTVKEIGGHGIGKIFHDEPFVPSYGKRGRGDTLRAGFCLTVEPMINEKSAAIKEFDIPGSTVKWYTTIDKGLSAQFEHTILITENGYEIMTLP